MDVPIYLQLRIEAAVAAPASQSAPHDQQKLPFRRLTTIDNQKRLTWRQVRRRNSNKNMDDVVLLRFSAAADEALSATTPTT